MAKNKKNKGKGVNVNTVANHAEDNFAEEAESRPHGIVQTDDDDDGDAESDLPKDTGVKDIRAIQSTFPEIMALTARIDELTAEIERVRVLRSPLVRELRIALSSVGPYTLNNQRWQIRRQKKTGIWYLAGEREKAHENIEIDMSRNRAAE